MTWVKTATTDAAALVTGVFELDHAEERYGEKPPVYTVGVTAGRLSCGLAQAYWDGTAGVYKYDLSSVGVGGTWEVTGEDYEEGKGVFVAWIGEAVWAGESPEGKFENAGVVTSAVTRKYAGDPTPWTLTVPWKITVSASHLWRERTAVAAAGRDSTPVYAQETKVEDKWVLDRPGSARVECGAASLDVAQAWNAAVEEWSPIVEHVSQADLASFCRWGVAGRDYAVLTLNWSEVPFTFTNGVKEYAAWKYVGDGADLTLQCTSFVEGDAGPFTVGVSEPLIVNFSGLSCKKLGSGEALDVQVAGNFKADPRYPETLGWRTTPGPVSG